MIRQNWKLLLVTFLVGVAGMLVVLGGMEVWRDHWTIHQDAARLDQVIGWINDVQKAQKK